MKRNAKPTNIVFGEAVFLIDDVLIGLTRDGGKFTVENSYRQIEADGDRMKVKGRIHKESGIPKIEISHLEILTEIDKIHPGLIVDTETKPGYTIIRGSGKVNDELDYHKVTIKGVTKDNREFEASIDEAINLENIDWEFKSKGEVIDKAIFEGVEKEEQEDTDEGWSVTFKNSEKDVQGGK